MRWMLAVGASVLMCVACDRPPDLVVDMRTDLVCGVEFQSAAVSIDGAPPITVTLAPEDDYLVGVRLAELQELEPGTHHVEVLLMSGARVIGERSLLVDLIQTSAVTAVFTRSCAGVTCAGATGDASRETCLGGTCVGGECTPETPASCPAGCMADSDCAASQPCITAVCDDGVCLESDSGSCGTGSFCHPASGCQPTGSESCPAFMQEVDGFCIDIFQLGSMTWTAAADFCAERGGDLCTEAEWLAGCSAADSLLVDATDDWEWTNDVVSDVAGKSGAGGCDSRSAHEIFVDPYGVRCCVPR